MQRYDLTQMELTTIAMVIDPVGLLVTREAILLAQLNFEMH